MSYRYFDIPNKHEIHCWEPIKRCYVAPDPIIVDSMYEELAYIFTDANELACLYDHKFSDTICNVQNIVNDKLVDNSKFTDDKVNIGLFQLPYDEREINSHRNFFFRLRSVPELHDFFQYSNHVMNDFQMESSNIHLYVNSGIFSYRNFLNGKRFIRHFWYLIKDMGFNVFELSDITDQRKNKRIHTHENTISNFHDIKAPYSRWNERSLNFNTYLIKDFEFQYATLRNELIEQSFNYY